MTDGTNTANRWDNSWYDGSPQQQNIDNRFKLACKNAKDAGITIYTIQMIDGNDQLLKDCATSSDKYYKITSANQTVRLLEGKLLYIDSQGKPMVLENARTEPTFKFANYGSSERLDPGQEAVQSLDLEFPAEALKPKNLKEIRLEFAYIPSPYREETVNFPVSIGVGK